MSQKTTRELAERTMVLVKKFATESMAGDVEFKAFGRRVILPDYRKEVLLRRKPLLKKIEKIPSRIWKAAEDLGYTYDLRRSEIREVELACYNQYFSNLSRRAKFLMAAVVDGKIRIDQLDEEQLLEFLTFPNFQIYLSLGHGEEAPNYIKKLFKEPEAEKKAEEPIEKPKVKVKAKKKEEKKSILDENDGEDQFI